MMISIRGNYEDGTIKLLDPIELKDETNVVITFLDDDFPLPEGAESSQPVPDKEDKPEDYYESMRKHKRYKARGNITILLGDDEATFPLIDYSAGGLSFLSDRIFHIGETITAALKYDASGEVLVMNFEIIVRGVFEQESQRYKIGCQFGDDVDEELWHTIMG